jgi:hypothetical protein
MMNGHISKKALMEYTDNQESKSISNNDIARFPIADVVEVVRCGECIHNYGVKANCEFNPHDIVCDWWSTDGMDETDFCSRGERRSE